MAARTSGETRTVTLSCSLSGRHAPQRHVLTAGHRTIARSDGAGTLVPIISLFRSIRLTGPERFAMVQPPQTIPAPGVVLRCSPCSSAQANRIGVPLQH